MPSFDGRTMLPAQPIRSLIDGLTCLQTLTMAGRPVGSRALSRELGIPHTRVNRYLRTLAHMGLAQQTVKRKYLPGPALHVFAAQSMLRSGLAGRAVEVLDELRPLGAVVAMGMLWGDRVCYLYHFNLSQPKADPLGRVSLWPATQSSIGMLLLSGHDDRAVRELFADRPIPAYDGGVEPLLADLAVIRERGYAYVVQPQFTEGTLAVGVGNPALAAVGVLLRRKSDRAGVLAALRRAAARIAEPFET